VEIVFETTRSHVPTGSFFSRVLQPFVVNLAAKMVYQDMRRMEELFRNSNHHSTNSNHHSTIAKSNGACGDSCSASARSNAARASSHPPAVSAEYPWARAAHPSPRSFCICLLITSLLILVGLLRRLCRRLRLVLRRGQVERGKPANTAIFGLGVAQWIGLGQPPASAVPRGISGQTQRR
jgi:hypothetical protein